MFREEFTNELTWGPEGYLIEKGLIPLTEGERNNIASASRELKVFSASELE